MIVGSCRIELYIAGASSFKDKRQVVKSLTDKISHRFNVSVSEVDHHDLHQQAVIGVAHVGRTRGEVERLLNSVVRYAENASGEEIVRYAIDSHDPENDI